MPSATERRRRTAPAVPVLPTSRASTPPRVGLCAAGEIWGGAELAVSLLADGLRGHGVVTFALLFNEGRLATELRRRDVPVTVLDSRHKYSLFTFADLSRIIRSHHLDILHVHGYKAGIYGSAAAAWAGVPVVKTEHGLVERPGSAREVLAWARLVGFTLLERVMTRATTRAVVAVSADLATAYRRHTPAPRLIHNGIIPMDGPPTPAFDGQFHIGIVGRLSTVKGHTQLIAAMERLATRDVHLHVYGSGPLERECRQQAERLGLAEHVTFHGFCDDMPVRLRTLHALVMPSLHEGLPFALLEAMSIGLPVIASRVGGICEVIQDGENGLLVPPDDVSQLAGAIERLSRDRALASRLGSAARRRIADHFHIDRMVGQHIDLYQQVLGGRRPRTAA